MWSKREDGPRPARSRFLARRRRRALNLTPLEAFSRYRRLYAVFLAITAAALTWLAGTDEPVPHSTVVVAARELSAGTVLAAEDLAEATVPEPVLAQLDGLFVTDAELIGRTLIVPLTANTPVTHSSILGSMLVSSVPEGTQPVTIHPQDKLSAQLIPPGSAVEVFEDASFEDGRTEPTVLTAQAIVLFNAYFQRVEKTGGWPLMAAGQDDEPAIVVAVPHAQARGVVSAAARGRVLLALSPPTERGTVAPEQD